ncbi:hypothetical protein GMLC_10520 [Geomonas limicola]|uniref:Uncharacterized protein n=1 Tax=Geomonas limicola TaxID=2740186 RepID=A0A6V8N7E5_9BACT|nr:hypothetical protein [Geomonas limicola]GFO67473.1 hypothetical protein GMLC_10520 [Geomonas limicola]
MSSSEPGDLAQAFATMTPQALSSILALLEEATVGAVMEGRMSDWLDKKAAGSEFARKLESRVAQLETLQQHQLCLNLYAQINQICEIPPRHYTAPRDFCDNCEDIITAGLALMRKHDLSFQGTSLHDLVVFQTGKMFGIMQEKFPDLPHDKQEEFLAKIRDFISELPAGQRAALQKELNLHEVSDEKLRTLLTSGALGTAFAATVGIGGFSFYMGASSLLAGITHLLGFSLPFAAYTSMSSLIAVLSNPLFLIAFIGGGAFWLISKENRKMRERLVPLVLTQSVVSSLHTSEIDKHNDCTEKAVAAWARDWSTVLEQRAVRNAARVAVDNAQSAYDSTVALINENLKKQSTLATDREKTVKKIRAMVPEVVDKIRDGKWGMELSAQGEKLLTLLKEQVEIKSRPQSSSFFGKIAGAINNKWDGFETSLGIKDSSKQIALKAASLWEEGFMPADPDVHYIACQLQEATEDLVQLKNEAKTQEEIASQQRAVLKQCTKELEVASGKCFEAERLQWGMGALQ